MKVNKILRKAHYYSEDRYVIKKDFFMVIDGATPLVNDNKKYLGTSASYFVSCIKKDLLKNSDVFSSLKETSKRMFKEFKVEDMAPSAGMSFIRIIDDRVICSHVGDTEIFIRFKDNSYKRIVDSRLIDLDNISWNEFVEKRPKYNSQSETFEAIRPTLIKHRKLMNKPNGYPIYSPSKDGNTEFLEESFALEDIKEIYLYTDGLADGFDTLNLYKDANDMLKPGCNIKNVVDNIVSESNKDKKCINHPRFKRIDDITVIQIKFD